MRREYHTWFSPSLGREMELLVFGHAGLPALVFPTSCGRFYDFEDRGMVQAVEDKLHQGQLQLICVDSVDAESWYNRGVPPRWRIARHVQYEQYLTSEVFPLIQSQNRHPSLATIGCSFGAYHAMNLALRHPERITGVFALGGFFNPESFLEGYFDDACYFHLPMRYLPNLTDPALLNAMHRNNYVLAAGEDDQCRQESEQMAALLRSKSILCRLDIWGNHAGHDWPWWQTMLRAEL
ncbi:MAG: esterase family protein [Acidobacteriota bacterium]|nr:esterase family protein [Acidobacteriota bacterium]